jgi:hypothetical protein
MTVLPMSYIPTFAVPLFLILHIICIAQTRRWPTTGFAATDNRVQNTDAPGARMINRRAPNRGCWRPC